MKFDMVRPCDSCPFCPGRFRGLRADRITEIVEALQSGATFACHKTTIDNEDGDYIPSAEERFCGGATVMLEKAQDPEQAPHNQMLRIAERMGWYDHRKLDMTSPVFDSFEEMIEAAEGS